MNQSENIQLSNIPGLQQIYESLMSSFVKLGLILRHSSGGGQSLVKENVFGDIQLDTDIKCEEIVNEELKKSGVVRFSLSEETPKLTELSETGKYIVTFDPLDGSSIIGTNFTVGTIVGIWLWDENLLIGQQGKQQVGACCCLYGSRISALFYNQIGDHVDELTYLEYPNEQRWHITKSKIQINKKGKLFAPGNLRAVAENDIYKKLLDYWIGQGYTLRYTGGLVPDVYQLFIKEQGILTNLISDKNPAKLRYLYEVAPLAFLTEKAGGVSSDGHQSLLEVKVENYTQKSVIVVGSEEEVRRVEAGHKQ